LSVKISTDKSNIDVNFLDVITVKYPLITANNVHWISLDGK